MKVKARIKMVVMTKGFLKILLKKPKHAVRRKWKKISAKEVILWRA
jgi:hypothetical protein